MQIEVTDTCHNRGMTINSCNNKDQHKYKLVVHVPGTQSKKKTKILEADNFDEVLLEMTNFRKEVLALNEKPKTEPRLMDALSNEGSLLSQIPVNLSEKNVVIAEEPKCKYPLIKFSADFLNFVSGVDVPLHLQKKLTKDHIGEIGRVMERFSLSLKKHGYNLIDLGIEQIGQNEIGYFCEFITIDLGIKSYNKSCAIMKSFYNWCIGIMDCE